MEHRTTGFITRSRGLNGPPYAGCGTASRRWLGLVLAACLASANVMAQKPAPDPAGGGLGDLSRLSHAKSRSISPENFTGEKGKAGMATEGTGARAARDLGQGWKISPSVRIKAGETFVLGEIQGAGAIHHIWMTPTGN